MITLTFTAPQQVAPMAGTAKLMAIHKRREPWSIHVEVLDEQGRTRDFHVSGALAQTLVMTLNKTNNSTAGNSEEQRVLGWLQANVNPATGATYLPAGTYSGSPD